MDRMRRLLSKFAGDMDLGYPGDIEEARRQLGEIREINERSYELYG